MVNPVKFFKEPVSFEPIQASPEHLDLSPYFQPAGVRFQPATTQISFDHVNSVFHSWVHPSQSQENLVSEKPKPSAHLQAVGEVVQRHWDNFKEMSLQKLALLSYTLPLPEGVLPRSLVEVHQNVFKEWAQMGAALRANFQAVKDEPLTWMVGNFGTMVDAVRMGKEQVSAWLRSDEKLTPNLTAGLVDRLLDVGMLAITKKIGPTNRMNQSSVFTKENTNRGTIRYGVEGTNVSLILQGEISRPGDSYNLKGLSISLDPSKKPKTYELLAHVLEENHGKIKMVSATVPVDRKTFEELMKSKDKPLKEGALAETRLGEMLAKENLMGRVQMIPSQVMGPNGKFVRGIEMIFTRS